MSVGSAAWKLSFELSPIILCGGIAQNLPQGVLPIILLTEPISLVTGLLSGGGSLDLDRAFAHFTPLPGSTLADNSIGTYPFANQNVAANAIIANPLTISMLMICPANGTAGYPSALASMIALKYALDQHDALAGTYTVVTPKAFYTNLIRTRMVDVSSAESKQPQNAWQIDFVRPLLTLEQAQSAQNSLMSKLTGGTQIQGQPSWSGAASSVGSPPSLAGTSLPTGAATAGTGVIPFGSTIST